MSLINNSKSKNASITNNQKQSLLSKQGTRPSFQQENDSRKRVEEEKKLYQKKISQKNEIIQNFSKNLDELKSRVTDLKTNYEERVSCYGHANMTIDIIDRKTRRKGPRPKTRMVLFNQPKDSSIIQDETNKPFHSKSVMMEKSNTNITTERSTINLSPERLATINQDILSSPLSPNTNRPSKREQVTIEIQTEDLTPKIIYIDKAVQSEKYLQETLNNNQQLVDSSLKFNPTGGLLIPPPFPLNNSLSNPQFQGQGNSNLLAPPPFGLKLGPLPNLPVPGGLPGGIKPSPPMMPGLTLSRKQTMQPMKRKYTPNVPMKSIPWTIIQPSNTKYTIWEGVDDTKIELDIAFLEKEFATKKSAISMNSSDPSISPGKNEEKIQKISVLPPERAKNIELILGKLRLHPKFIVQSVLACDAKILTLGTLESLCNIMPNETETQMLAGYDGDLNMLANADRLIFEASRIPGYQQRVFALKFNKTHSEMIKDLVTRMEKVEDIYIKYKNDNRLKLILKYALGIGNYMNGQSNRGGAYGFKIDMLDRMADIKTMDGKKNLLAYVIEFGENHSKKSLIEANEDLTDIEYGIKNPLAQLIVDLNEIKKQQRFVQTAISKQSELPGDVIKDTLSEFNMKIIEVIADLDTKMKKVENAYEDICKFYCDNPKETQSDKLFEKILKIYMACRRQKETMARSLQRDSKKPKTQKNHK